MTFSTEVYTFLLSSVFGLLAIALTIQGIRGKRWWLLATLAFGSWCECVGNGVRIYGHFHTNVTNPYIAQQVILVLTPWVLGYISPFPLTPYLPCP